MDHFSLDQLTHPLSAPAMPESVDLSPFIDSTFFDFDQFEQPPSAAVKLENQQQYQEQLLALSESVNTLLTQPLVQEQQQKQQQQQQQPQKKQKTETRDEDVKKRNTAASARFRIKKKQREQEMERQVKELSARISRYNDRINQLETENACLKSLILEKNEQKSEDLVSSIRAKTGYY